MKQYHERFHWPLAAGIVLLLLEFLFPERSRRAPTANPSAKAAAGLALLLLCFSMASTAFASPGSALREYKQGNYDHALRQYEELLKNNADDPRLHFNAGTAAYRNGQFDEAARQFGSAVGAPDLNLQQSAYYNRGNALFRQGEQLPDPNKRIEHWQKALKDYELTMKLNPQDNDAKFNHQFVKQRLEELKQQQSQQQKSDKNQDDKQEQQQDQQPQDNPQNQNQEQQQDQSKQQDQQPQPQQQDPNNTQQQQNQSQPQEQQPQSGQEKQDGSQQPGQAAQPAPEQPQDKKDEEQMEAVPGQMTRQQAQQLLDAQKGDEKVLTLRPENKPIDPNRPFKDW